MPEKKNHCLLLYGSQTGQAEAITEEIQENSVAHGLEFERHCLSQVEKKFTLEKETCVVIVTSTTGDGEPPDTALKFFRRLKKKTLPSDYLSHLNYALLGLGDSNYTNFCNAGKTLDRRLEELGAKRFYPSGWADDAVGLEQAVEPWIEGLFPALKQFLSLDSPNKSGPCSNKTSCDSNQCTVKFVENTECVVQSGETEVTNVSVVTTNGHSTNSGDPSNNGVDSNGHNGLTSEFDGKSVSNNGTESLDRKLEDMLLEDAPSLRKSVQLLCDSAVTVPLLSPAYLIIKYNLIESVDRSPFPLNTSAASNISNATIISADILTSQDALKKTMKLGLKLENKFSYQPGDSVSIYCQNEDKEVEMLLKRLNVQDKADCICQIELLKDTKKAKAMIPLHLPAVSTLRNLFTYHIDIREPPKKSVIRQLVEETANPKEKRRLQELCSKQGMADYTKFIRNPEISILDLLQAFPSSQPSVERLIESLPKLQPRPYSACSSPLKTPGHLDIVFNVVNIPEGDGRSFARQGICTGMLDKRTSDIQNKDYEESEGINGKILQLQISARSNQFFHLPVDVSVSLILIGPGTGVAPFVGFLQHREIQKSHSEFEDQVFGEIFLFFGCRNQSQDFLFREELKRLQEVHVLTKLFVSFSRENQSTEGPKYVQDNILKNAEQVLDLIENKSAVIYVCGDAKNMAKDVNQTFMTILQENKGLSESEARSYVTKLRLEKRYLEDVWT
ncbi:methionine synthase reductase-like [Saccostrea echinata]|uniref:methionine synthase reductase-like n=1 Tax=Saccostrea echinata TaxID=191078 RepID=UPI002A7F9054|nr:methionine synthase reductase-like [Saccostrea echinata]